jgi:hypothetical protein
MIQTTESNIVQAHTICEKYVELACEQADYSMVESLAIDETSRSKGQDYVTLGVAAGAKTQRYGRSGDADGFGTGNSVFAADAGINRGRIQISTCP